MTFWVYAGRPSSSTAARSVRTSSGNSKASAAIRRTGRCPTTIRSSARFSTRSKCSSEASPHGDTNGWVSKLLLRCRKDHYLSTCKTC